ncbi:hypothetical protein LL06_12830 [Hoeflea sp. BAL378]|uniref:hypothetical protein n=1 Tax=Hoeflea sp. BAL378 TaxID=1547437 RepID=UPI0005135601|nr:hypothetical protein [Hoeflea sp. BAL378]KGF69094.1 hypothetical protein LL06_12830 [Hoeflea sp. BAL378]
MSVIQAVSYSVSAVAQSHSPPPARDASAGVAAARAVALPAGAPAQTRGVSNRVNAYISTERTNAARSDRGSSGSNAAEDEAEDGVDLDEALTYRPNSRY